MKHSAKLRARSRRIRVAAWSGVGLAAAVFTPVAAIAAGQPLEIRVAYLDPGVATLIWQSVVAALAAVVIVIRVYWRKIRALFRRSSRDSEPSDTAPRDD
jgi:uncharacterized membrane protein